MKKMNAIIDVSEEILAVVQKKNGCREPPFWKQEWTGNIADDTSKRY